MLELACWLSEKMKLGRRSSFSTEPSALSPTCGSAVGAHNFPNAGLLTWSLQGIHPLAALLT